MKLLLLLSVSQLLIACFIPSAFAAFPQKCGGVFLGDVISKDLSTWVFKREISRDQPPLLADHAIHQTTIVAAAASIDNLALGAISAHEAQVVTFENVKARKGLFLCEAGRCEILKTKISLKEQGNSSINLVEEGVEVAYMNAKFIGASKDMGASLEETRIWQNIDSTKIVSGTGKALYTTFDGLGLNYGPTFKTVQSYLTYGAKVQGRLGFNETFNFDGFAVHPAILDGLFQLAMAARLANGMENGLMYIPAKISKIKIKKLPAIDYEHPYFTGEVEITSKLDPASKTMKMDANLYYKGDLYVKVKGFLLLGTKTLKPD